MGRKGRGFGQGKNRLCLHGLPCRLQRDPLTSSGPKGHIFIVGFEAGLRAWKPFLKKGGYMVVSDADWFESNPPSELVKWWESEGYVPESEDEMKERVKKAGLRLVATYRLPEAGWWENYYVPMLARIAELRKTHGSDPG